SGIEELRQIWPDATTLNLKGFKDFTDAHFHSCVQKGTDIQVIDLTDCRQITDAIIAPIVHNCPDLKAIHLECALLSDEAIQTLKTRFPYLLPPPSSAFGKAKWETYFGEVGEEPSLPPYLYKILASPCPFDQTKTVRDTH